LPKTGKREAGGIFFIPSFFRPAKLPRASFKQSASTLQASFQEGKQMTNEEMKLVEDYIKYLKLRSYSMRRKREIENRIKKYFDYLHEADLNIFQIKLKEAAGYQKWLLEQKTKSGSSYSSFMIACYMVSITRFYNYLKENHQVYTNPFIEVKKIRVDVKIPRNVLKPKDMIRLLNELAMFDKCDGNMISKITRYKVHVACELMYAAGLRSFEVSELKPANIDFDKGIIHVEEGKGGVSRIALLNDYAKGILKIYLDEMRELTFNNWNQKNGSLFGMGWERFNHVINDALKKVCIKLNLPQFTSHCFRHSVGYHLLKSGLDIRYIQAILGHKRLSSTEIYTKVDKEDLREVLNKYHPRQFKKRKKEQ
jgi:site-specific recombinase XerD